MSLEVNFAQGCRDCRKYYEIFKIDLNKYYYENGDSIIKTQELYEKFSFICPHIFESPYLLLFVHDVIC